MTPNKNAGDSEVIEMNDDNLDEKFEDMTVQMKANEFEIFRTDKTLDNLIRSASDHSDFENWNTTQIKSLLLAYPNNVEKAKDEYTTLISGFTWRFNSFFDSEDSFEEFQTEFTKTQAEIFEKTHNKCIQLIQGESPSNVLNDKYSTMRIKEALDDLNIDQT